MNYQRIHNQIIQRALIRNLDANIYVEKHHIIPRCLGGDNEKTNLVKLTPREHFLIHWLLYRIHPNNRKLAIAFSMMSHCSIKNRTLHRSYKVSSRIYQEAKEGIQKAMIGRFVSNETKKKLSDRIVTDQWRRKVGLKSKGRGKGRKISEEQKAAISKANKGRKLTDKEKQRVSEVHKGKKLSEEHRLKFSLAAKGKKRSTEQKLLLSNKAKTKDQCPYCNVIMQLINLKRWHFENCKFKNHKIKTAIDATRMPILCE